MPVEKKISILQIEKKNYHLFLDIKINLIPCRLLLDTGASKTVFDTEKVLQFVKAKHIIQQQAQSLGLGDKRIDTQLATLKNWEIGKLRISKHNVAILPLSHVNEMYQQIGIPEIDGVLGSDFLMKYQAIIHYQRAIIKLQKKK